MFKKIETNTINRKNSINNTSHRIENRDMGVLTNPLVPPLKRNYHLEEPSIGRMPINIETRESGGDYQQVGMLHKMNNIDGEFNKPGNNDKTVLLQLFGKPLYKASSNWNYYILDKNKFKIPLNINNNNCSDSHIGCHEINNNDEIDIEQYNGKFKAQILKFNAPKYIPYIY